MKDHDREWQIVNMSDVVKVWMKCSLLDPRYTGVMDEIKVGFLEQPYDAARCELYIELREHARRLDYEKEEEEEGIYNNLSFAEITERTYKYLPVGGSMLLSDYMTLWKKKKGTKKETKKKQKNEDPLELIKTKREHLTEPLLKSTVVSV